MSIVHIPFYPSDWMAGTRALSDAETGVYITLLAHMYEMAGPIERDDNRLFRMCGCRSKASFVKSLEYLIGEGKIVNTPDGLFNERAQKVIEQTTEKSVKAKAAAQSRWDRKANKNNADVDADVSPAHMPQPCQPKPKPYRDTNVSLTKRAKPERFQEFWNQYPHRGGAKKNRKQSLAKYARAVASGVSEQKIISAAIRYASDAQVLRGYGRNPDVWLNNEGWNDDIEPTGSQQDRSNPGRSSPHDSLVQGFAAFANSDDDTGGGDFGSGETSFGSSPEEMDCGPGGHPSQPILRIIGSE